MIERQYITQFYVINYMVETINLDNLDNCLRALIVFCFF